MSTHIRIPDLLAEWPYEVIQNSYADPICEESAKWHENFRAFDAKAQAVFNQGNIGLFSSLVYHTSTEPAHFRAGCDLQNFFFLYDDLSDKTDGPSVRELSTTIMDALKDPYKPRPPGECVLGEVAKDFWSRALPFTSESSARRFVKNFGDYTDAVITEAEDRDHGHVRGISQYFDLRRETVGMRPTMDFMFLPEDLPDSMFDDPCIKRLTKTAIHMVVLANDIYSYNKEQACGGDSHNMVTIAMQEKGLDIQGAMDYIGEEYHRLVKQFHDDAKKVPIVSEPVDKLIAKYVTGLRTCITANIEWSLLGGRYFGAKGHEVKSQLIFELQPKTLCVML